MSDLNDLLEEQMRDMYDGKMRLFKSLGKFEKNASDPGLRQVINGYRESVSEQILHMKQAFSLLFWQKRGETNDVMEAMLNEARALIKRSMHPEVRDAGVITALQHIIHYQIAGYGAICNYANTLGYYDVAGLMHQDLEKEKQTDTLLAQLAEEAVNARAISWATEDDILPKQFL